MSLRTLFLSMALASSSIAATGYVPARSGDGSIDAAVPIRVSLTGYALDAETRQPLSGVWIRVRGSSLTAETNRRGRYILQLPDESIGTEVTVVAGSPGYIEATHVMALTEGSNTWDVHLTPMYRSSDPTLAAAESAADRRSQALASNLSTAHGVLAKGPHPFPAPAFDREGYALIDENNWVGVDDQPLSTFSIDVDRASYSNVRRFIREGRRPPIDAVRVEELINYFPYGDPAPRPGHGHPFAVATEVGAAPWQPLHQLVRIGVKASEIEMSDAPANNLVFLLDVSGSMNSANKLPLLKKAFAMLVDELRPTDRVAIVVYAGAAGVVLPSTPGSERETILGALESLSAGGSTAGGAGIRLAYSVAEENFIEGGNNRVILATDGDFNVGASSDAEMVRLIEEKREGGTFLTVLGFGTGNLQEAKMEQIADHGNGNFAYIDSELEARKVLVTEMGGTLLTVAKDVKIQVEFNPARVAAYRLIGYENRLLAAQDFNDDTRDAGELGAGHTVTALYEIVPVGVETPVEIRTMDALRYQRDARTEAADNEELLFVKLRYKEPGGDVSRLVTTPVEEVSADTSDDFRFAAAVAAWGMLLRDSEHCADYNLADVARMARGALGEDVHGYRTQFLDLVDHARALDVLARTPGT